MQQLPVISLAPFRGITNKTYRNAFAKNIGGVDHVYAPFLSGTGVRRIRPEILADLLPMKEQLVSTIPQVLSNNAQEIVLLGNTLSACGYKTLNWNLGCPFSRIAYKKKGCGILPYPELLEQILEHIFKDLHIGLSIKTRLGYHHPKELASVLPVLNQFPIKDLIIHPRTGKQLYSGKVCTKAFAEILKATDLPLVYNGDIYSVGQYQQLQKMFPEVTRWMIGRGALIDPFLPTAIKGKHLTDKEKRATLLAFHQEIWEHVLKFPENESKQLGRIKAIWHYLSGNFSNGSCCFKKIRQANCKASFLKAVMEIFNQPFAGDDEKEWHFTQLTK